MLSYICLLRNLAYKKYDRKYLQQGLKYGSQLAISLSRSTILGNLKHYSMYRYKLS